MAFLGAETEPKKIIKVDIPLLTRTGRKNKISSALDQHPSTWSKNLLLIDGLFFPAQP